MDNMAAYYPPPPPPPAVPHYPYYHPPPPPSAAAPAPATHHLPQPHAPHQQQSPYGVYAPPLLAPGSHDEVRTLFVAGLPEDVKPREIYNLFREFPGYESSHLRSPTQTSQPFAFAVFLDRQYAIAAMHALNGMVFDLEKGSTLYLDLAKANSRSKRQRTDDGRFGSDKRSKRSLFSRGANDSVKCREYFAGARYLHLFFPSVCCPGAVGSQGNLETRAVNETMASHSHNSLVPHLPQNNTSCPTLFVANLGPTCTEQELVQVFSRCPGFIKLKMQGAYGSPVAFVDFQDTACSTGARNHLQGTFLFSSTGEGMRIEFAKSRMGMRKKLK